MNKNELAEALAEETGMSKSESEKFVNAFVNVVTKQLVNDSEVNITGFGSFSTSHRAGRMGVNPQNPSQKIQIPPTTVPKFKAGKGLKDSVKAAHQEG